MTADIEAGRDRGRDAGPVPWTGDLWAENWLTNFRRPENARYDGMSIADIAAMRDQSPFDDDVRPAARGEPGHLDRGPRDERPYPRGVRGASVRDDRERRDPVRRSPKPAQLRLLPDRARRVRPGRERHLRLPEAIRKITSFPAQRLGLPDRGILRDGFRADIVCFDPATVRAPATRLHPKQYAEGVEYVIVNGQVVIERGENTGALPGRALRRGRART